MHREEIAAFLAARQERTAAMFEEEIAAFLAVRPDFDPEHVRWIASKVGSVGERGIPFCRECADWHFPDEPHSSQ